MVLFYEQEEVKKMYRKVVTILIVSIELYSSNITKREIILLFPKLNY